jgi:Leucine-rich repeat (LRR) protein
MALMTALGAFFIFDYAKQNPEWIKVYEQDFTKSAAPDGMVFFDKLNKSKVTPWPIDSEGLRMERMEWVWLEKIKISDSVRVSLKIINWGTPDALETCINSGFDKLKFWWLLPAGYAFQFGGYGGTKDLIFKTDEAHESNILSVAESSVKPGQEHIVIIERKYENLSMTVDGNKVLGVTDFFPPSGGGLDRIGFRSFSSGAKIESIAVHRLALPEKASPLIAGDTLVEHQLFPEAVTKYLTIAENYGVSPISEKAMAKAYLTAATKLPAETAAKQLLKIKSDISMRFPKFAYRELILEVDALVAWKQKNYQEAFKNLAEIFTNNPNNNTVMKILQYPHQPLPEDAAGELLSWVKKTKNIKRLNISGLGLKTLAPLKGMSLVFLDCSSNQIDSLEPLTGMELEYLSCSNNKIETLEPIKDLTLKDLNCSGNKIQDLSPLGRIRTLKYLDFSENDVSVLEPLRDLPLERLMCNRNHIPSLESLQKMQLKILDCSGNSLEDLDPLREMSLEKILCRDNKIKSLGPLANMPLEYIDCSNNRIDSLAPLANMPLKYIDCSGNDIDSLKTMENMQLQTLNCSRNPVVSIEPLRDMPIKSLELYDCVKINDFSALSSLKSLEKLGLPPGFKDNAILKDLKDLKAVSKDKNKPAE